MPRSPERKAARGWGGKLTRLRPPHKDECCVTAQGWRGREETRPPRHADSFAPAYRPERSLRLRAGGLQRLAPARRTAADRHAARCASQGLCSGVRPSTLYALVGDLSQYRIPARGSDLGGEYLGERKHLLGDVTVTSGGTADNSCCQC